MGKAVRKDKACINCRNVLKEADIFREIRFGLLTRVQCKPCFYQIKDRAPRRVSPPTVPSYVPLAGPRQVLCKGGGTLSGRRLPTAGEKAEGDWGHYGPKADAAISNFATIAGASGTDAMWVPDLIQFICRRRNGAGVDASEVVNTTAMFTKFVYHALSCYSQKANGDLDKKKEGWIKGAQELKSQGKHAEVGPEPKLSEKSGAIVDWSIPFLNSATSFLTTAGACVNLYNLSKRGDKEFSDKLLKEISNGLTSNPEIPYGNFLQAIASYFEGSNGDAVRTQCITASTNVVQGGAAIAKILVSAAVGAAIGLASTLGGAIFPLIVKLSADHADRVDRERLWSMECFRPSLRAYVNMNPASRLTPPDIFGQGAQAARRAGYGGDGFEVAAAFACITDKPRSVMEACLDGFEDELHEIEEKGARTVVEQEFSYWTHERMTSFPVYILAQRLGGRLGYVNVMRALTACFLVSALANFILWVKRYKDIYFDPEPDEQTEEVQQALRELRSYQSLVAYADLIVEKYLPDPPQKQVLSTLVNIAVEMSVKDVSEVAPVPGGAAAAGGAPVAARAQDVENFKLSAGFVTRYQASFIELAECMPQ